MTAHRFGSIVGLDTEGVIDPHGAVHLHEIHTVAVHAGRFVDADRGGLEVDQAPLFGVRMLGRVNKSEDTVDVVFLMPPEGLALLIGMAFDAAGRSGAEVADKVLLDAKAVAITEQAKREGR